MRKFIKNTSILFVMTTLLNLLPNCVRLDEPFANLVAGDIIGVIHYDRREEYFGYSVDNGLSRFNSVQYAGSMAPFLKREIIAIDRDRYILSRAFCVTCGFFSVWDDHTSRCEGRSGDRDELLALRNRARVGKAVLELDVIVALTARRVPVEEFSAQLTIYTSNDSLAYYYTLLQEAGYTFVYPSLGSSVVMRAIALQAGYCMLRLDFLNRHFPDVSHVSFMSDLMRSMENGDVNLYLDVCWNDSEINDVDSSG